MGRACDEDRKTDVREARSGNGATRRTRCVARLIGGRARCVVWLVWWGPGRHAVVVALPPTLIFQTRDVTCVHDSN